MEAVTIVSFDTFISRIVRKVDRNLKITFISSVVMGLLTHFYMLTNKLPNHDDVNQLVDRMERTSQGRWFLTYPASISGIISMPWFNGILAILYLSVASCLIVKALKINRPIFCAFVSGLIVTVPSTASTLSYMQCADPFCLSILLACLSVYITDRKAKGFLVGIPLLTLSLGIYQAQFGLAACLFICILIFYALDKQKDFMYCMKKTANFLTVLVVGLISYWIILKLRIPYFGVSEYHGINEMISIREIPYRALKAYKDVIGYYLFNEYEVHTSLLTRLFWTSLIVVGILFVYRFIKDKVYVSKTKTVFLVLLIITLPLAASLIHVLSPKVEPHMIMIQPYILMLCFGLAFLDNLLKNRHPKPLAAFSINAFSWIFSLTLILCIFQYSRLSNISYQRLQISYEQAYSYGVRLISRIEQEENYSTDLDIVFVDMQPSALPNPTKFIDYKNITGVIYPNSLLLQPNFYKNYLGVETPIRLLTYDNLDESVQAALDRMACYPDDGSIYIEGESIYVKFTEHI